MMLVEEMAWKRGEGEAEVQTEGGGQVAGVEAR